MDCTETAEQVFVDVAYWEDYSDFVTGTPSVGWREGDGELRFDGLSRQPTADELSEFIRNNQA
jgi:hypothetical protein